ncbi:MAG: hypothetical protein HKN72_17005 [Gemmatimonadetes bacterium]|nr:hypothetical protein [Gemmatimonadota bacterium]NNL31100.1 hypothetical protein [Gemmatimonadota bacterium]
MCRCAFTPLVLALAFGACDGSTDVEVLQLFVEPEAGLVAGVGETSRFLVMARGAGGSEIPTEGADWVSDNPDVARVDERGVATGVTPGTAELTVRFGGRSATAVVEVFVPPDVAEYEAGVSYFGRNGYVEYIPGTLPVILSAPHGGDLTPSEIAERTTGVVVTDRGTRELTLAVRDAFIDLTGAAPHVVISHLDRVKLDPNREIVEAAQGDPFAERAWEEYHGFIEMARLEVALFGEGMYFDMHGHGHPQDRLELGYLLLADRLNDDDDSLNSLATVQQTSIREIGRDSELPFSQVIRGPTSLGGLLEEHGVPAVPSPSIPGPGSDPYFSGGYSTWRHGSLADTELVSGIQIEHHYPGLRNSDANRRAYATLLADAVRAFMLEHMGYFEP